VRFIGVEAWRTRWFLCTDLGVVAVVCFATGLILDLVAHVRREAKRLVDLQHPALAERRRETAGS